MVIIKTLKVSSQCCATCKHWNIKYNMDSFASCKKLYGQQLYQLRRYGRSGLNTYTKDSYSCNKWEEKKERKKRK